MISDRKQQVLIVHGGSTFPNNDEYLLSLVNKDIKIEWIAYRKDWKTEIQSKLGDEFIVYTPQMPNRQNAQYEEWKVYLEKLLEKLQNNLIIVAHSLGSAFVVKYLSENDCNEKLQGIFLLGTPFNGIGMDSEKLNSFFRKDVNLQRLNIGPASTKCNHLL